MLKKPLSKFTDTRRAETELEQRFGYINDNFQRNIPHFDTKQSADKAEIEDNRLVVISQDDKSVMLYFKINGKLKKVGV